MLNSSNIKINSENESNNVVLNPPPSLCSLFNQFNNSSQTHENKDPVVRWKYYDLKEIQSMEISNKNSCLSLIHINTCYLNKKFEDLEYLIKSTYFNFDIKPIS